MKICFFTPVVRQEINTAFDYRDLVDEYLYIPFLFGKKAWVINSCESNYEIEMREEKLTFKILIATVAKIISYISTILPLLALGAKIYYRSKIFNRFNPEYYLLNFPKVFKGENIDVNEWKNLHSEERYYIVRRSTNPMFKDHIIKKIKEQKLTIDQLSGECVRYGGQCDLWLDPGYEARRNAFINK